MKKKELKKQIKRLQEEVMRLRAEKEQLERALNGQRSNIYIIPRPEVEYIRRHPDYLYDNWDTAIPPYPQNINIC